MEKQIQERYTDTIKAEVLQRFGIAERRLKSGGRLCELHL